MRKLLKYLGVKYLIPWVDVTEEMLDANDQPCSMSGLPPYRYKTSYSGLYWLGHTIGFYSKREDITVVDYLGSPSSSVCPKCRNESLYVNKMGEEWCEQPGCDYRFNHYEEKEDE